MVDPQPVPDPAVRVIHLVAKTHLDLGFTALASEVERQYLEDFFPRAIEVATSLRERGGPERLTWTTGSWILHRSLEQADTERAAAVDAAVRAGHLAWHALPLTTHTELMDAPLFRSGLGISHELDARFGRATTAAKMTDVPGHTRSMVPLLAEAGVTFLHLGVNPAWPVPDVPRVFRWRSPDGAEVTVAYQAGGYGGDLVISGCDEALAFLHSGDNLGPPSVDDVLAAHADLRSRYPGAEVRASTLDAFARSLAASGAVDELPVVTAEIGDPWLFGAGSDPQKVTRFRDLLRWRARFLDQGILAQHVAVDVDRTLLLVAEHTWGLDQKVVLPVEQPWDADALLRLRTSEAGRRFESSWVEQRDYVDAAARQIQAGVRATGPHERALRPWAAAITLAEQALEVPNHAVVDGMAHPQLKAVAVVDGVVPDPQPIPDGDGEVPTFDWELRLDPATGAIIHLLHRPTGRVLADVAHPLGLLSHQTFDEADYERFYATLRPTPEDEWWARRDNTKPGIDAAGAPSERALAQMRGAWVTQHQGAHWRSLVISHQLAGREVLSKWSWDTSGSEFELQVSWTDKVATRLPEATWCSFNLIVAEPDRWEIDKLGQRVSPLDVVRRGGRSLHAVGEGMHYEGPDGRLTIATPDAPLVAPGGPNLLDADPPVPDLADGFHVLLHDNCWGTNFPMWNEGPAAFRFTVSIS